MGIRLRAWLIDLVREAVRLELAGFKPEAPTYVRAIPRPAASKPVTEPIVVEPSFEQMQADAIQAQEEHYAPN